MIEQPGDDSGFVNTARKVLLDCAPRLGLELDRTNFSFLCDKMARMFVPRFHDYVFRCEPAWLHWAAAVHLARGCGGVQRITCAASRGTG
jgi:hypothetical protein